ncbi:hypothetical protein GB937_006110 [Aspergillus fischeri]|nr:hypothetical protein GB937_006110 [Aspergillus fischeri]
MVLGTPFQTPAKRKEQCANKKPSLGIRVPGQRADVRRPTDSQKRPSREPLTRQVKRIKSSPRQIQTPRRQPAVRKVDERRLSGDQGSRDLQACYPADRERPGVPLQDDTSPCARAAGKKDIFRRRGLVSKARSKFSHAQLGMNGAGLPQELSGKENGGSESVG